MLASFRATLVGILDLGRTTEARTKFSTLNYRKAPVVLTAPTLEPTPPPNDDHLRSWLGDSQRKTGINHNVHRSNNAAYSFELIRDGSVTQNSA